MNRNQLGTNRLALAAAALGFALALPAPVAHAAGTGGPYGFSNIQIPFSTSPSRARRPDSFMHRLPSGTGGMNWQSRGDKGMDR